MDSTPTPHAYAYINYIAVAVACVIFIIIVAMLVIICTCTNCCEENGQYSRREIQKGMSDNLIPPVFYTDADPLSMGDLHDRV